MRRAPVVSLLVLAITGTAMVRLEVDPRLVNVLDPATRDAVGAIVDSMHQTGLPTESVILRALEGAAKRQSPRGRTITDADIIAAARREAELIRRAGTALGPGATAEEITAGAAALKAGVPVQQLQRLRDVKPGQRYASALGVLTYIVGMQVPADTASRVVVGLILASASDAQLSALQADVERDIGAGTPAGLAATTRGLWLANVIAQAQQDDGGAPGSGLPSVRGSMRSADPAANGQMGTKVNATKTGDGSPPAAPRGRPKKKP